MKRKWVAEGNAWILRDVIGHGHYAKQHATVCVDTGGQWYAVVGSKWGKFPDAATAKREAAKLVRQRMVR